MADRPSWASEAAPTASAAPPWAQGPVNDALLVPVPTPSGGAAPAAVPAPTRGNPAAFSSNEGGAATARVAPKRATTPASGKQNRDVTDLIASTGFGAVAGTFAPELLTGAGLIAAPFPLTAPLSPYLLGLGSAARGSRLASTGIGALSGFGSSVGEKGAEAFGFGKTGQEIASIVGGGITPEFAGFIGKAASHIIKDVSGMSDMGIANYLAKKTADFAAKSGESVTFSDAQKKYIAEQVKTLRGEADPKQSGEKVFGALNAGAADIAKQASSDASKLGDAGQKSAQTILADAEKNASRERAAAAVRADSVRAKAREEADLVRLTNSGKADKILADADAEAKRITADASKRFGRIQSAKGKTVEIAGKYADDAERARSAIGIDHEHSETGRQLRDVISERQKGLLEQQGKQRDADQLAILLETQSKEAGGDFLEKMPEYQRIVKSIEDDLRSSPAKHSDPKVIAQLERLLTALSPQKRKPIKAAGGGVDGASPDRAPESITQFVARNGGLNEAELGGDLADMKFLPKGLTVGLPSLINRGGGSKSPGAMRDLLETAGFMAPGSADNEMLDLLRNEFNKGVPTTVRVKDMDALSAYQAGRAFETSETADLLGDAANPAAKSAPVTFNAIEEVRRSLQDAAFGKPASGYEAIGQQLARDYYKKLSSVLGNYSPASREFISNYESLAKELDVFKGGVGRRTTAIDRHNPMLYVSDAKNLPGDYFRSKQGVGDLLVLTDGNEEFVKEQAGNYAARELRGLDSAGVGRWLNKNSDWLDHPAMTTVRGNVERAQEALARAESKQSKSSGALKKLLGMGPDLTQATDRAVGKISGDAEKGATKLRAGAESAAEKALNNAERGAERELSAGERSAGTIGTRAASDAAATTKSFDQMGDAAKGAAQKRVDLILGDATPERRVEEIILSGSPKVWAEVGPILVKSAEGKRAFSGALRNVLADQAEKSPKAIAGTYRKDIRPFMESSGLLSSQELSLLDSQLDSLSKTVGIPEKLKHERMVKVIVQAVGGYGANFLGQTVPISDRKPAPQVGTPSKGVRDLQGMGAGVGTR